MNKDSIIFPDDFVEVKHMYSEHIRQWLYPSNYRAECRISVIGGTGEDLDEKYRPYGDGINTFEVHIPIFLSSGKNAGHLTKEELNNFIQENKHFMEPIRN